MLGRLWALFRQVGWFSRWQRSALAGAFVVLIAATAGVAHAAPDSAIVIDAKTGKVLYSNNADSQRYPASLTKMMTLYMLFDAIESGRTSLDATIKVSAFAASQPPSKLGIKAGGSIKVKDAILALVTRSANDIATAIGEHLAGSEKSFAQQMTAKARQLGMSRTTFRNAHGLPNTAQVTTARDMALLGRALQDHFPQYFGYFKTRSFVWQGKKIGNHNGLLGRVEGVNGIKTGYTRASGFNLVTSIDRDGRQLVAVVIGGETAKARDKTMVNLIEKYLPKASRGGRTAPLVAGGPGAGGGSGTAQVNILVARNAFPMPRLRPTVTVVATAAAPADMPVLAPVPAAAPAPVAVAALQPAAPEVEPEPAEDTFARNSVASLIGANSIFALDAEPELLAAIQEGDAAADEDVEDAADAVQQMAAIPASQVIEGWKIQLAATDTQRGAEEILDKAMDKAGKLLADASPYTEPVQAGNGTMYRARFAGFADKASARAACAQLARYNFNCLAISN